MMRITVIEHHINGTDHTGQLIFDKLTVEIHTDRDRELDSLQMGSQVGDLCGKYSLLYLQGTSP